MQPVDEETAARVIAALSRARVRCISPVLALDTAGVLMTDRMARCIRRDTLHNTAELLRTTRVTQLHRAGLIPKDPSPATLLRAVAGQVDTLSEKALTGEFR